MMSITATEQKSNLGKYLLLASHADWELRSALTLEQRKIRSVSNSW